MNPNKMLRRCTMRNKEKYYSQKYWNAMLQTSWDVVYNL